MTSVWKGPAGPQQSLCRIYTVPLFCTGGLKVSQLLAFSPVMCRSASTNLLESPLLHILHLESSLEPRRERVETHVIHYTPYEFTHHSGPLMRCYVRAKQRSLLGSFSGFNKVSLLQTLEAVHEHAALWLWSRNITQRNSQNKAMWHKCHAALTGYAIPTCIIKSYSHHKDRFKYYSKT